MPYSRIDKIVMPSDQTPWVFVRKGEKDWDDPQYVYDYDAMMIETPNLSFGEWAWRLPNELTDGITQPMYPQHRWCLVFLNGEHVGRFIDPFSSPSPAEIAKHERSMQAAAKRVLKHLERGR